MQGEFGPFLHFNYESLALYVYLIVWENGVEYIWTRTITYGCSIIAIIVNYSIIVINIVRVFKLFFNVN